MYNGNEKGLSNYMFFLWIYFEKGNLKKTYCNRYKIAFTFFIDVKDIKQVYMIICSL